MTSDAVDRHKGRLVYSGPEYGDVWECDQDCPADHNEPDFDRHTEPDRPGECAVALLTTPIRPEFPWRVRCPRCGWVDTFRDEREANQWAWRHDKHA